MGFQVEGRSVLRGGLILTVVAAPCAYANGITALALTTFVHLFLGNAVIGVGEGILLALVFRVTWWRAILLMIVANYLSAWAGMFLLAGTRESIVEAMLPADPTAALAMMSKYFVPLVVVVVVALYLLTILVEWPMIFAALGKRERRGFVALKASVLLQTISYAVLVFLYWSVSAATVFTDVTIDPKVVSDTPDNAWVYFLSDERNALCRMRINGTKLEEVKKLDDSRTLDYLAMTRETPESDWNLEATGYSDGKSRSLILVPEVGPPECFIWGRPDDEIPPWRILPEDMRGDWSIDISWSDLSARNQKEGKRLWLSLETPLLLWQVNFYTHMPGDRVVFQLGPRIVLLEPDTARLGGLAVGRCPTVVLDVDD